MTPSVELAHVYRAELEANGYAVWAQGFRKDWPLGARADTVLLFVDDYPEVYSADEKREVADRLVAAARLAVANARIDLVAFESSCATVGDTLCANLPLEPGHWFTTNGTGSRRATLLKKDDPGLWMCAALSAVWTLARLGEEPYHEAVLADAVRFTDAPLAAECIATVLPTRYIDNEAAVVEILRQLRKPRIPLSRVQYVFT